MDARQMQGLMKQMGLKTLEIESARVVVEKKDGSKLVVESPQVTLVEIQGQKTLQVTGEFKEEAGGEEKEEDDADLVVKETRVSRAEAEKALAEAQGDLAQAILSLKKEG